jgi:2,3-bisphosphoglycerate-independent phosphoglycerate mutase
MAAAGSSVGAKGPVVLVIRDGWGRNPHPEHDAFNAVKLARTPCADALERDWPTTLIRTSGEDVGLPVGPDGPVMGNSEVGHQNLGAGRIVDQELMRITRAIRGGDFARNATLRKAFERAKAAGRCVHVMGLVSDGQVHSDLPHLEAILELAKASGFPMERLFVHAFTDGRDTPTDGSLRYLPWLETVLARTGGRIATVCGRFYAMDRDHRWERVKKAYDLLVGRAGARAASALEAVRTNLANPTSATQAGDEFTPPTRVLDAGMIADGDSVIFFNFRGDRPRELCKAFMLDDAAWKAVQGGGFDRAPCPRDLFFATMAEYEQGLPVEPIFHRPEKMKDILGQVVSDAGLTQFRCAETEKFPHVTFFFNDYREEPFPGEHRTIVPSPKDVPTYDLKPEMSALGVRDAVLGRLAAPDCERLFIVNFANPDMVGHTGSLPATIKACETVDACVQAIIDATLARGGELVVTADHGNAELMKDPTTGAPHTAHTNFTVPLTVVGSRWKDAGLRQDGRLGDVAPTLLQMLGLAQPGAMEGRSLLKI